MVREFGLRIAREDGSATLLGEVDLSMSRTGGDDARIVGRFAPAVGVASDPAGVVWLEGALQGGPDRRAPRRREGSQRRPRPPDGEHARRGLSASAAAPPIATAAAFDPEGRVDLVAEATYEIGSSILPSLSARAAIAGGSLALPGSLSPPASRGAFATSS